MEVTMIGCDNPHCNVIGRSESEREQRKGQYLPPYGWIIVQGIAYFGCGPYAKRLMVCQIDCLKDAVRHALERDDG